MTRALIAAYLVGFVSLSLYLIRDSGYWSVFPPFASGSELQMFCDLGTALTLFNIWALFDVRSRGKPLWHAGLVLVGICAAGSICPLIYLILRGQAPWPTGPAGSPAAGEPAAAG
jgi:hypothetical protein